jgi:hypothetical protein
MWNQKFSLASSGDNTDFSCAPDEEFMCWVHLVFSFPPIHEIVFSLGAEIKAASCLRLLFIERIKTCGFNVTRRERKIA